MEAKAAAVTVADKEVRRIFLHSSNLPILIDTVGYGGGGGQHYNGGGQSYNSGGGGGYDNQQGGGGGGRW